MTDTTPCPVLRRFLASIAVLASLMLAGCGYDDDLHTRHGMLKLLWTEQYGELDKALDRQYQLYQQGKLKARQFAGQLRTLRMADSQFAGRFQAWAATRPDSRWADLTQGLFLLEAAWKARGQDIAARTPPSQMAAMREQAAHALEAFRRAADKGVSPALYGGGKISADMLMGDTSASAETVQAAMRADPRFWLAPSAYFQQLYPQWGGSEIEMQRFVDSIRSTQPELASFLDADMLWRAGLDYETSGQAETAMRRYESAIAIYPHADALKNLGELYVRAGRCKDAVKVLETNLEKNDEWDLWTLEMLHQAQTCNGDTWRAHRTLSKRDELIRRYHQGE